MNNHYIDESAMKVSGEPIEYDNVFISPPANGLTVEEIEYDEYLAELEKFRRNNKQAEVTAEKGNEEQQAR